MQGFPCNEGDLCRKDMDSSSMPECISWSCNSAMTDMLRQSGQTFLHSVPNGWLLLQMRQHLLQGAACQQADEGEKHHLQRESQSSLPDSYRCCTSCLLTLVLDLAALVCRLMSDGVASWAAGQPDRRPLGGRPHSGTLDNQTASERRGGAEGLPSPSRVRR